MSMELNLKFVEKYLTNIEWNKNKKGHWQVKGMLKNISNQVFTFDVRHLKNYAGETGKSITLPNKADKILMENKKEWVIIDTKELLKFVKDNNKKKVYIKELDNKTEWNIKIKK